MKLKVPLQAGTFFSFQQGHILLCRDMRPCELELGAQYSISEMLSVWDVNHQGEHVGFFFFSPFKIECGGGYLVAFREATRGQATSSKLMLRHDSVMVYDLPGCGAMALSTKLSPEMESVIQEQ